jgi:DUF1680 family protein
MAVPLFYSYSPVYQNERWTLMGGGKNISSYARFGCCIAIGAAGLGIIPTVGVVENNDCITVGLYIAGEYNLSNSKIRIETEYPYDGCVKVTVLESNGEQKIKFRVPEWCDKCTIDGLFVENDGFVTVTLAQNESVTFTMEMPYKIHSSSEVNPEVNNLFAITKGPVVLCADSCETDLYKSYSVKGKDGYAVGTFENGKYNIDLTSGEILTLREYRTTGKNYYVPREISIWLKK